VLKQDILQVKCSLAIGFDRCYTILLAMQARMKKALRETQTLRALAVVRFRQHPPTRPPVSNTQTRRQDRLQYNAPQL